MVLKKWRWIGQIVTYIVLRSEKSIEFRRRYSSTLNELEILSYSRLSIEVLVIHEPIVFEDNVFCFESKTMYFKPAPLVLAN